MAGQSRRRQVKRSRRCQEARRAESLRVRDREMPLLQLGHSDNRCRRERPNTFLVWWCVSPVVCMCPVVFRGACALSLSGGRKSGPVQAVLSLCTHTTICPAARGSFFVSAGVQPKHSKQHQHQTTIPVAVRSSVSADSSPGGHLQQQRANPVQCSRSLCGHTVKVLTCTRRSTRARFKHFANQCVGRAHNYRSPAAVVCVSLIRRVALSPCGSLRSLSSDQDRKLAEAVPREHEKIAIPQVRDDG